MLDPEPLDHELREARFVPLTGRERAQHEVDLSLSPHRDVRTLAREAGVDLDVVRDADPAIAPAPAGLGATPLEPGPVGENGRAIEGRPVIAAVVNDADGVPVRHR